MSVIVIANDNLYDKYYEIDYPIEIKKINLKPIFMYDIDYAKNSEIILKDNFKKSLYEDIIIYSHKDREKTINILKTMDIIAMIPYTEDDVIDAEYFNHYLNTPSNPIETSICRRDKYYMQEEIKKHGLTSIIQKKCYNINNIDEFVLNNPSNNYVIKPLDGSATYDVYLCNNIEELYEKFELIINKTNTCNLKNNSCLIQEYIDGEDWIVNSVSRNGIHKIINVMKSYKYYINNRHFMYLQTRLIEPKEVPPELYIYAFNVLNALKIINGAGHAEIKMSSKGPCLIEIGARVGGGQNEKALSKCIVNNYGPIKTCIYSYCDKNLFNKIPYFYSTHEKYTCITINNLHETFIWNDYYIDKLMCDLSNLVEIHKMHCLYKNGDIVFKTQDLLTIIGRIYITSYSEDKLDTAFKMVKQWETDLFFYI